MSGNEKLVSLESLRGIAAISVALFHFKIGGYLENGFIVNSWLMVDLFFVLSGFVISLNYATKLTSFNTVLAFQKRRFLRLYPLHFATLLVWVLFEWAKYFAEIKLNLVSAKPAFSVNDETAFFANLVLLHNWLLEPLTFNYPSWSISAEFVTYFIFAIAVFIAGGDVRKLIPLSIMLAATGLYILYLEGMGTTNVQGPARCVFGFFLGVVTHQAFNWLKAGKLRISEVWTYGLTLLAVVFVIKVGHQKSGIVLLAPIIFSVTILSMALSESSSLKTTLLGHPALVYLGTISYGIYMLHAAVWWVFGKFLQFIFGIQKVETDDGKMRLLLENPLVADCISLFGLALIVFVAHLSYKYFETRFLR